MTIESLLQNIISELKEIKLILYKQNQTVISENISGNMKRLIPLTKWNKFHEWPTQAGFRHIIFYSEQFKADKFVTRMGRRILIDEDEFFKWVKDNPKFNMEATGKNGKS